MTIMKAVLATLILALMVLGAVSIPAASKETDAFVVVFLAAATMCGMALYPVLKGTAPPVIELALTRTCFPPSADRLTTEVVAIYEREGEATESRELDSKPPEP